MLGVEVVLLQVLQQEMMALTVASHISLGQHQMCSWQKEEVEVEVGVEEMEDLEVEDKQRHQEAMQSAQMFLQISMEPMVEQETVQVLILVGELISVMLDMEEEDVELLAVVV